MKTKQIVVLLILAVALLLLVMWSKKREQSIATEVAAVTKTVISNLTSGTVERIVIAIPDGTSATLTRKEAVWYTDPVKGHRADKFSMNNVFDTIGKELTGEVVGTNPDTFGEYQVNETSATHVVFYGTGASPIEDLYIGKSGTSRSSTYVRKSGQQEVLNVNASLAFLFNKPDGWRDKSIFDIPHDAIVGIAGEGTSGTYELKKVVNDWMVVRPEEAAARKDKAQSMASVLSSLRVSEFVDVGSTQPLSDFGLDPPMQKVTVTREDRSTSPPKAVSEVLLLGKPKEGMSTYYAKRADSDSVYTISSYHAQTLAPNPSDLLPPKPAVTTAPTSGTLETTATTKAADVTSPSIVAEDEEPKAKAAAVAPESKETTATVTPTATAPSPAREASSTVTTATAGQTTGTI